MSMKLRLPASCRNDGWAAVKRERPRATSVCCHTRRRSPLGTGWCHCMYRVGARRSLPAGFIAIFCWTILVLLRKTVAGVPAISRSEIRLATFHRSPHRSVRNPAERNCRCIDGDCVVGVYLDSFRASTDRPSGIHMEIPTLPAHQKNSQRENFQGR